MADRPNIVYIFTDQQFGEALSCAGNPDIHTPALDTLASRSTRFSNAYCSYPLCVPSRMSMISGRMPHEMGIFANCHPSSSPLPFPTMGTLFSDAGYETCWVGKWHLTIPEEETEHHGFRRIVLGGDYGGRDREKADMAANYIRESHSGPFLLVVSLNNPHDCCELSRGDELRMGALPPLPPNEELPPLPDNWEIPVDEPDFIRTFAQTYDRVFPAMRWTELEARRYLWGYYRLVEMVDRDIGRVLEAIDAAGLAENSIIVFSSDHGDGACRHRWNQKFSLYDESARVPLIISAPGHGAVSRVVETPVSAGLDLLPTVCEYADISPPEGIHGLGLRSAVEGVSHIDERDYVPAELSYSMWADIGEDRWPKARMIRTDRYKYIAVDTGGNSEQLTDMRDDPGEMTNLASVGEYERVLETHRTLLDTWCMSTGDTFTRKGRQ